MRFRGRVTLSDPVALVGLVTYAAPIDAILVAVIDLYFFSKPNAFTPDDRLLLLLSANARLNGFFYLLVFWRFSSSDTRPREPILDGTSSGRSWSGVYGLAGASGDLTLRLADGT